MIGEQYGPFDLVVLECGQYNEYWNAIHMMPEQTVQAAAELRASVLFPVHWGKFTLSLHAWDEPIIRAVAEAKRKGVVLIHPLIGEKVLLSAPDVRFSAWWESIK